MSPFTNLCESQSWSRRKPSLGIITPSRIRIVRNLIDMICSSNFAVRESLLATLGKEDNGMTFLRLMATVMLAILAASTANAQYGAPGEDWPHYAGDQGSTKYSPLDQIDTKNFGDLEVLWRWDSADNALEGKAPFEPFHFRATPIVIDGIAYLSTGLSQVAAVDLASGETLWVHDPESYERGPVTHGIAQHRGVEYWTNGVEERVVIATGGRQLVSLDAKTGSPDPHFADGGWVEGMY